MVETTEVQQLIEQGLPGAQVSVTGDGSHFDAEVISAEFEGLNTLKRQQKVFGAMGDAITSGRVHALNIKAMTPQEKAGV